MVIRYVARLIRTCRVCSGAFSILRTCNTINCRCASLTIHAQHPCTQYIYTYVCVCGFCCCPYTDTRSSSSSCCVMQRAAFRNVYYSAKQLWVALPFWHLYDRRRIRLANCTSDLNDIASPVACSVVSSPSRWANWEGSSVENKVAGRLLLLLRTATLSQNVSHFLSLASFLCFFNLRVYIRQLLFILTHTL